MAQYSKKAESKIATVMHEFKEGKLKSGKDGKGGIVKNPGTGNSHRYK